MKFNNKLTFQDHVRGIVCCISQRICILMLVKHVLLTSLCDFVAILYCSPVWWSASECHPQLL